MTALALAACGVEGAGEENNDDNGGEGGGGEGGGYSGPVGGFDTGGPDEEDDDTLPTYPTAHPRIYLTPNRARLEAALAANTPAAAAFRAKVDQWVGGANIWGFEAWNGALLGQLTGDARYCAKAIAVVEAQVVAAEAKIAAGQKPDVGYDSYLKVGEMIGDLALTYDWCFEQVTPAQKTRWIAYANQAVWNVWNHQAAKWGNTPFPWTGWSTNNPSNNFHYSFLRATMLLGLATKGENPQADAWITKFRDEKVLAALVPLFNTELVGGGSREGTGYGVSHMKLFELYDLWHATTGEKLATKTTHTRASMLSFIHQTMPTLDKVAPTGDHTRDQTAAFYDYHRNYLLQLMTLFPTSDLAARAKALLDASSVKAMTRPEMLAYDFLNDNPDIAATGLGGLNTAYYAKGIGQIYARSSWDKDATWINMIAGPYTESHAHQDQGSILIFKGGWLAYDANIASKTGINQAVTTQSLVRIDNGSTPLKQHVMTSANLLALSQGTGYVHAAVDVTPVYKNAAVQKVERELVYLQPDVVVVFDRVTTAGGTRQTWQLAVPSAPQISGNTATVSNGAHSLKVTKVAPAGSITTYDHRGDLDITAGYRIDQSVPGGDNRFLNVLSIDGAVTNATANGATGVTLTLSNGQTATVQFNRDAVGGTLTLDGKAITLGAGVTSFAP